MTEISQGAAGSDSARPASVHEEFLIARVSRLESEVNAIREKVSENATRLAVHRAAAAVALIAVGGIALVGSRIGDWLDASLFATRVYVGPVRHNGTCNAPWGTVDDWYAFVVPTGLGSRDPENPANQRDDGLIYVELGAVPSAADTWKITANSRYMWSPESIKDLEVSAQCVLLAK